MGLLLAACSGQKAAPRATAIASDLAAVTQPTPTLVPGLPTAPPPTPAAGGENPRVVLTATPVATVTPLPTLTPTPAPSQRLALGEAALRAGDYSLAATHLATGLDQATGVTSSQREAALLALGIAYLEDGHAAEAADSFNQLLAHTDMPPTAVFFYLGQANEALSDYRGAIGAYQSYLAANPDMVAYVNPYIADAYTALDQPDQAVVAIEAALGAPSHRLTEVSLRQRLASYYLAAGQVEAAVAQYDAIRDVAITEFTKGEMTYLAGVALLAAGDNAAAYGRFQSGIAEYPRAYESYLGLVALVDADIPVDDFQRGLVNFYAQSYQPGIAAFERYIAANPENYRHDAHLYLSWCYEGVGNVAAALASLEALAASDPVAAGFERAKLLQRTGDTAAAIDSYLAFQTAFPEAADAPAAAWQAAALSQRLDDTTAAIAQYRAFADTYGQHVDAPEALFWAGWLASESGDLETAVTVWQRAAETYPAAEFGAAAIVWLLRTLPAYRPPPTAAPVDTAVTLTPPPDPQALLEKVMRLAAIQRGAGYFALRTQDIVAKRPPFTSEHPFALPDEATDATDQLAAETWLRDWLALPPGTDVRTLPATLAHDSRLVVGQKLWQIGQYEAAKRELETLRQEMAGDALASYQLALFFRDLGLYRSSIIAASSLLSLSGQTALEAPAFIGRLAFPAYYSDLITALARRYSFDPRLQLALVRQESLFESFATSGAAAQGLSQVIPDTGAYIARLLDWPDFKNADLYKPYVGLTFGAFYLQQQLGAFDNDVHAALAAYNAGPGNAARWYERAGSDLDIYLETVNFAETRLYIERIYVGYVMYRALYGRN